METSPRVMENNMLAVFSVETGVETGAGARDDVND